MTEPRLRVGVTRRDFLRLAGLSALGAGLAACSSNGGASSTPASQATGTSGGGATVAPPPVQTLKVGHQARQLGNIVSLYPEIGPQNGVNFDVVIFPDGAAMLNALTTGDILMAGITKIQLVQAMDRGVDLVMLLGYAGGYAVFVTGNDVPVPAGDWKALKDYAAQKKAKGETFKLASSGSSLQDGYLAWLLKRNGIDAQKDVEVVNVPFADHARVLELGQADMAAMVALFAAQALSQNKGKLFLHATNTPAGQFEVGFVSSRKLLTEKPEAVQPLVNAHFAGVKRIVEEPGHGLARDAKYAELPEPIMQKTYEFLRFDYRVDLAAIAGMEKMLREVGWTKGDLSGKLKQYVDLSYLAKASGMGVDQLSKW